MNIRKPGILVVASVAAVCLFVLALLALRPFVVEHTAVPFQDMRVEIGDEDGVATIHSDAFRVAFAGHSFGPRHWGGSYLVDGRYGFRLFACPESADGEVGGGVTYRYSQRRRLLAFRYRGHEVAYSHASKQLTVDGREYSTAGGPVHLLVGENGEVKLLDG